MIYNTSSSNSRERTRIFKNNLSYDNELELKVTNDAVYTHSNNSWDLNYTITNDDFVSVDSADAIVRLVGERLPDGTLPDLNGFLELSPGSGLIDAGIDVESKFNGEGPDVGALERKDEPGSTNSYPFVEIVSPHDGSSSFNTEVTITVNASDPDGSISKVEVHIGDSLVYVVLSEPWTLTWNYPPLGTHLLRAVAIDNDNARATSSLVRITVMPDSASAEAILLYPNPNNGKFTFLTTEPLTSSGEISIVSLEGKVVFRSTMLQQELSKQFDLSHINQGLYTFFLSLDDSFMARRFLKL